MERFIGIAILVLAFTARGSLYSTGSIPDGNPVGVALTGTYDQAAAGATVSSLTVNLSITGGYNGDLYGYLVAPNGTRVLLMDRPGVGVNGFGASGAGMNITLQDGASANGNIQNETSGSVLGGTYNAAESLSGFNGSVADGTWTLFFADLSSGGGTSVLGSWSLGIVAVPEPANVALGVFGGVFTVGALARFCRIGLEMQQRLAQHPLGRMVLHATCICRGGKLSFHWVGIRRELRKMCGLKAPANPAEKVHERAN